MKIISARIKRRTLTQWAMLVQVEDSTAEFVLFTWDVNRMAYTPEEFLGLTVEEAIHRAQAAASLLMQEDALIVNTK